MLTKKIGTYREQIKENTEEIEGYDYIDVDYVTEILDEIESKLGDTDDLVDVTDSIEAALDGVKEIILSMSNYVSKEEIPGKLGNLFIEIREHAVSIKDNLSAILQTVESVADTMSDLSDDLF